MTLNLPAHPIRESWAVRWNNEKGSGIARAFVNGQMTLLVFATKDAALDKAIAMNYAAAEPTTHYTVGEYWED